MSCLLGPTAGNMPALSKVRRFVDILLPRPLQGLSGPFASFPFLPFSTPLCPRIFLPLPPRVAPPSPAPSRDVSVPFPRFEARRTATRRDAARYALRAGRGGGRGSRCIAVRRAPPTNGLECDNSFHTPLPRTSLGGRGTGRGGVRAEAHLDLGCPRVRCQCTVRDKLLPVRRAAPL